MAVDVDQPLLHFCADPIAGVAENFNSAPLHIRAEVHADRAVNGHATSRHGSPNPAYLVQRAMKDEILTALAVDIEEIAERQLALPVIDLQRPDFLVRKRRE